MSHPSKQAFQRGLTSVGRQVHAAGHGLISGIIATLAGIARNVVESLGHLTGGVARALGGAIGAGLRQAGLALVELVLQTPLDALLMLGGRMISTLQTLVGLEVPGRNLYEDERALLERIFGSALDLGRIRIKEGRSGVFGAVLRAGHASAFVHGDVIYVRPGRRLDAPLLVHEATHVWQHQNGGTDYLSEALWAQWFGDGYNLAKGLMSGLSFAELNPEQQAVLLQVAWQAGVFDPAPTASATPSAPRRFLVRGEDRTAVLLDALEHVRRGVGAP